MTLLQKVGIAYSFVCRPYILTERRCISSVAMIIQVVIEPNYMIPQEPLCIHWLVQCMLLSFCRSWKEEMLFCNHYAQTTYWKAIERHTSFRFRPDLFISIFFYCMHMQRSLTHRAMVIWSNKTYIMLILF